MAQVNRASNPYPTHGVPLPATPQVYPSKRAQKRPKRPRIEGDRANFDEFHEISHISFSFGPKNTFLACSKAHGYRYCNPYQYPEPGPGYPNPCHSLLIGAITETFKFHRSEKK